MEAISLWASRYGRQMVGFAAAALGMQLFLAPPILGTSFQLSLVLPLLLFGWVSAVFGAAPLLGGKPQNEMLPFDPAKMRKPYRVYWLGLLVFVAGCGVPIVINALQAGWTERALLGGGAIVVATVFAAAKALWDARADQRKI